jgi:hypothetical protein
MRVIVTSKSLVEQLQKLKFEVAATPNPILGVIEEFLKEIAADASGSKAGKVRIKKAFARLTLLKSSKLVEKVKRLVFNTKYLRHLKNFFSYSSCTNNIVIIRRILLKLLKKSPEEETAIYLHCKSNSFFNDKNFIYANTTIGYYR